MKICDAEINLRSYDEIISLIFKCIDTNTKSTFSYINPYICLFKSRNKKFEKLLNNFNYLYPDGVGIYLASKFLYKANGLKEYITGTDLLFKLFSELNNKSKSIFIYGGDFESKNLLKEKMKNYYPNIKLTGFYEWSKKFDDNVLQEMNNSKSDILFVGLGTPYQEEFVVNNVDKIKIPVIICVGSGINFLSGYLKRAPLIMRKLGLEWLFRIIVEPKRLFFRYFFGIPLFIFKIMVQKFKLLLNVKQ